VGRKKVTAFPRICIRERKLPSGARFDWYFGMRLPVTQTPCRMGGNRHWYCCPNCKHRCEFLYLGSNNFVACRLCLNLIYSTETATPADRLWLKVEKIRSRLGWPPGIANGHWARPRYMHQNTFEKLVKEHDRSANLWLGDLSAYVEQRKANAILLREKWRHLSF
jgi:hypothetical protein